MKSNEDRTCNAVEVKFENLCVIRNGRAILENINAIAPIGGATVLVGPNGAGKTTLLRCLLGEIKYSGHIEFVNCAGKPVLNPVIGYVPQQLQADAEMPLRVYEFLSLATEHRPLWLGCSNKSRNRAKKLLGLVNCEKLEKHRLGDLSGGELRRVLLASALGRKPDLLVLDEAEAGVDYRGERLFWQLLDKSRAELGFTLIMVSHNLPLAAHYASHVICIKTELYAEGAPHETLTGENLLNLFGVPIHLYPQQCQAPGPVCNGCGAFGNLPYLDTPDVMMPPAASGAGRKPEAALKTESGPHA